jgi:hypothetical protein
MDLCRNPPAGSRAVRVLVNRFRLTIQPHDLNLWKTYKEARALIKFEPDSAAPARPSEK